MATKVTKNRSQERRRPGTDYSQLGHRIAIACAICGIGLIVAAPLNSVVYGVALLGLAIALDVVVAVNCFDSPAVPRRMSHPRLEHMHTRKHSRASGKRHALT